MFKLVELTPDFKEAYYSCIAEWKKTGEEIIPSGSVIGTTSYEQFLRELDESFTKEDGFRQTYIF
ncbi:MAG: hypothetical protein ACE3JK_15235 [Sporolactobacillus sp.]